eukprot:4436069-Pyramimonas_sp.AAC.1
MAVRAPLYVVKLRGIRARGMIHRTTIEGRGARAKARRGPGGENEEHDQDARGAEQSARQQKREVDRGRWTTTKPTGGDRRVLLSSVVC